MIDEAKVAELKTKHGELFLVEPTEEENAELFVVVKYDQLRLHFDAFMETARDEDANRMGAMKNFLRDVIVFPERDALNARFEKFPGLALSYFRSISAEAKTQLKLRTKKL